MGYAVTVRSGDKRGAVYGGLRGERPKLLGRYCSSAGNSPYDDGANEIAVSGSRVAYVRE